MKTIDDTIAELERIAHGPKENKERRGPLLRKPDDRKRRRREAKQARKRNR